MFLVMQNLSISQKMMCLEMANCVSWNKTENQACYYSVIKLQHEYHIIVISKCVYHNSQISHSLYDIHKHSALL